MEFSSLVWSIPLLLLFAMVIAFTLNHNEKTTKINISISVISFLLSLFVIVERYFFNEQDYGYYIDWFVLDNYYYRIGYELNHTSAFFLVIVTALNVILHFLNRLGSKKENAVTHGYLNLIFGLITGIIISDNVLTYYILSFCTIIGLYLKLAHDNDHEQLLVLRKFSKSFIIGHLLFLCALLLIFYHQPNHAVEFTVIDSSLKMQPDLLNMDDEWIIGILLVSSTLLSSTIIVPFERQFNEQTFKNIVSLYLLISLRIILPVHLLIRFESLIRIDERVETAVIVLGVFILFHTVKKVFKQNGVAATMLNMSNAMLGMLYIMYGLQAKLLLSALALIYVFVHIFSSLLVQLNAHYGLFRFVKGIISIILFLPFIVCISASKHFDFIHTDASLLLNSTMCLGLIIYSLIVFTSLKDLTFETFKSSFNAIVIKRSNVVIILKLIIVLATLITVSLSWWKEFVLYDQDAFILSWNGQFWVKAAIISSQILLGLILCLAKTMYQRKKNNVNKRSQYNLGNSHHVLSIIKTIVVNLADKLELYWDKLTELIIPNIFKKAERFLTSKQPNVVVRLISLWVIAAILSIMLVIIRG